MESPAFGPGTAIPKKHTCSGADVSPALVWTEAPPGTTAYALVCEDPDAPSGTWDHWVLYDVPGAFAGLTEGLPATPESLEGWKQGRNGWGKVGYQGPCPPPGVPHRYFFRLYALRERSGLGPSATKEELLHAIAPHVIETAELVGTFGRP